MDHRIVFPFHTDLRVSLRGLLDSLSVDDLNSLCLEALAQAGWVVSYAPGSVYVDVHCDAVSFELAARPVEHEGGWGIAFHAVLGDWADNSVQRATVEDEVFEIATSLARRFNVDALLDFDVS